MEAPLASLNFYRRHGRRCAGKHAPDSIHSEAEERRRGFKKCECKIYANGTLDGLFRRFATKVSDWPSARQMLQPYLDANSWEITPGPLAPPPPPAPSAPAPEPKEPKGKILISEAITRVIKSQRNNDAAEATLLKYETVLRGKEGLEAFAAARGLRFIEEWTPALVRDLIENWDVTSGTRRTKLSVIKPFFEFFVEERAIELNPARIRLRRNVALRATEDDGKERLPFSNQEVQRMLDGCNDAYDDNGLREWPKKANGRKVVAISYRREYARKFNGGDVADFIELSFNTGLRFMDVAKFHVSRLNERGEVKLRAAKNKKWVCLLLPPHLRQMIHDRAQQFGPYIFGDPTGRKDKHVYDCWYQRLNKLWEKTGPWEQPPQHHRFRHTFVRMLLERGASVPIVANLIGDSEETVRKHYANWVPELQQATHEALLDIQARAPRFRRGA